MDTKYLKVNRNIFIKNMKLKYVNEQYFKWFDDHEIKKYITYKPKSVIDLKKNVIGHLNKKNTKFFAVFYKKIHVGNIKIDNISIKNYSCIFGIMIGNHQFRNIGLGSILIKYVKNWAQKNNIFNIYLGVHKNNKPAVRLYEKNGFFIYKETKKTFKLKINLLNCKVILGGAQLESNYGITNRKKKLSYKDTNKILNTAINFNINQIDLSENYNINIRKYKVLKKFKINTKISTKIINKLSYSQLKKIFQNYFLNGYKINILFIHDGDELFSTNGKKLLQYLKKLKKDKLILKIGISIYNFSLIHKLSNANSIDVIQLPYSILDKRSEKYFKKLQKLNIKIHARSIFLQGCLLKKTKNNVKLNKIYDLFSKFCKKNKINNLNACTSYVLGNSNIDKVVIGVRSNAELTKIMHIQAHNQKLYFVVNNKLKNYAINPHKW
jgi:aryl-alcohol dehydrogenase-like predicted oxidoreductase